MKYICLVYHEEQKLAALTQDELDALVAECGVWVADLAKGGHHVFSAGLQSVRTATTLRKRNGMLGMTDGPFAETKEFLGGFTIINAKDADDAIQLVRKLQTRMLTVEVRPVMEPNAELTDPGDRMIRDAIVRFSRP